MYFGVGLLTVGSCLLTGYLLPKFAFYRYYTNKAARARGLLVLHDEEETHIHNHIPKENGPIEKLEEVAEHKLSLHTYFIVFKEVWRQLLDIFLVFFRNTWIVSSRSN